jgi:predicted dehydrogenase
VQAEDLAADAKRRGLVLMADHTWLGHAGLRAKLDHAREARCLKYEATRLAFDTRGFDALEDMLPHDAVLARHAFKRDVTRVIVPAAEHRVILDFGGHHAQATYRYDVQNKVRKVEVWAADASYAKDGGELPEGAPEPLSVILDEFVASIREGREPRIGGAVEFVHVAAVIEAAKASRAKGGVWVDVER